MVYVIYAIKPYKLFCVRLFLFDYVSGDVAQCEASDRMIKSCASDVTYSQGVRGDIRLDEDSIKQHLILVVHLGVIMVEIKCTQ